MKQNECSPDESTDEEENILDYSSDGDLKILMKMKLNYSQVSNRWGVWNSRGVGKNIEN